MAGADVPLAALLAYTRAETERWAAWFARQPATAWDIVVGTGRTATMRDLVLHIAVVDMRYAQRLAGEPVSTHEQLAGEGHAAPFALAARAHAMLAAFIAAAPPAEWDRVHTFQTLSAGERSATTRKIVLHTLTHGMRHWAQLATALRQHGHPSDWPHDLLLSDALA